RGKAFGFHRALDHTGAVVGPLLAILFLDALHVPMRMVFMIAVIPGAIGVVLLIIALREKVEDSRPRLSKTDSRGPLTSTLPSPFWYAIAAIALFSLANSSDAFLLLQAHAAGVSTGMLPALWAAHHVIKSVFSTQAGSRSDRMDRRNQLALGWTIYAAIYFAFPYAQSMTAFVVLFVAYAIPFTLTEGAERAWIGDLVPAELRGRSFGLYYLATGLFVFAGTAIFGVLYQSISPRAAFFTGAGIAVFAAVWVIASKGRTAPRRA
ncbi:MAG TPA: MFS transporter, partial [Thermoanaerobaculia bacterium]|nr:MFS transporter [Thermoanaerobaculia bacterium]